jgi:hypothetical protein
MIIWILLGICVSLIIDKLIDCSKETIDMLNTRIKELEKINKDLLNKNES